MTSTLMLALLLSITMVIANHYFPWMWFWRRGMPGLMLYAIHLGCLIVPLTGLFLNWGYAHILGDRSVFGNATAWIVSFWILAIADLATELVLYCLDRYIQQRASLESYVDENDSLRAELSEDPDELMAEE